MRAALLTFVLVAPLAAQDQSLHVPMQDGTLIAIDVHLPTNHPGPRPTLFELTRYWRASESASTGRRLRGIARLDRAFLDAGYALVKVDVRGTGASMGTRDAEYGPREVRDGYDLVQWAVEQPWCDGQVGAYGTSYSGTTAELLAACGHPAVKAVIPGWSDWDVYASPGRPYGLYAANLIDTWSALVAGLDSGDGGARGQLVARVDADEDGSLREQAFREHAGNIDVGKELRLATCRNTSREGRPSLAECSVAAWKAEIEEGGAAFLVLASWFDAGTAGGAFERLRTLSNDQKLIVLASSHGGLFHASPFVVGQVPFACDPPPATQTQWRLAFFDHHLKGLENGVSAWPRVQYHNLGEEGLRQSEAWPPANHHLVPWFLGPEGALERTAPASGAEPSVYAVDHGVSTGPSNRWATQLGGPVLGLHDRGAMDERMACWTSAPLERDLQLTGTPRVSLSLTPSTGDAAPLIYLEVVDPKGQSRYLTEGGLHLGHIEGVRGDPPQASFAEEDWHDQVGGERVSLRCSLWPISVRIPAGSRLRVALAGADADTFDRLDARPGATFTVHHAPGSASLIELPVIE